MTARERQRRSRGVAAYDAAFLERAGVVLRGSEHSDVTTPIASDDRSSLGLVLIVVAGALCAFFLLWALSGAYGRIAHQQGADTLRASILSAADQCYAVEGAYPRTLADLEQRYALSVDHEGYDVFYDAFASNIAPTVVVKAL